MQEAEGRRLMVLLEGNIGAGKTTVGRALEAHTPFEFIEEPTKAWQEKYGTNMLELFYSDTARWAFTFQVNAFVTRAKTWHEIGRLTDSRQVILERSIFCDRFVFAENCYRTGLISAAEYGLYLDLWRFTTDHFVNQPDLILYLRTPAEECLRRMRARGRYEEVGVPLSYLEELETLHDEWLLDNPRTLVIDGMQRWPPDALAAEIARAVGRA